MNIVLLNGSPKGSESVTLQFAMYLAAQERQHSFTVLEVARRFRGFERDPARFDDVVDQVANADVVIWAFPLYYLLVSSGYKRFIELIFERNRGDAFAGRCAIALSTSIHFYDHTAHNYIRAVSEDLGMHYLDGYPAGMHDLFEPEEREHLLTWFRTMIERASMGESQPRAFAPVVSQSWEYAPEGVLNAAARPAGTTAAAPTRTLGTTAGATPLRADRDNPTSDLVVVTATMEGNTGAMVRRFERDCDEPVIIDLSRIRMGPCLGCLKCGFNNVCAYEGTKDEFVPLFRDYVLTAKKIVYAGTVHDRYLSALWQRHLERSFVVTHQPRLTGKHIVFLISGPLAQNANTREILLSWAETNGATVHSLVTDESGSNAVLDAEIDAAARQLREAAEADLRKPKSFRGVAGLTIFREEIQGGLRAIFQGDHAYYRAHGLYRGRRRGHTSPLRVLAMTAITRIPFMRRQVQKRLKSGMVAPYRRVVRETSPNYVDTDTVSASTG